MPFSNEPSVELIRSFVKYLFIVCLDSPTMWKYIRFPNQYMILLSRDIKDFTAEGPYIFRVAKNMSKMEIKEYLNKIYNVRVTRVNTSNMLGKGYRYSRSATLKEPDWKKAYVYIDPLFKPTSMTTKEAVEELKRN